MSLCTLLLDPGTVCLFVAGRTCAAAQPTSTTVHGNKGLFCLSCLALYPIPIHACFPIVFFNVQILLLLFCFMLFAFWWFIKNLYFYDYYQLFFQPYIIFFKLLSLIYIVLLSYLFRINTINWIGENNWFCSRCLIWLKWQYK